MNEITTRKRLIELLKFWNILEVEIKYQERRQTQEDVEEFVDEYYTTQACKLKVFGDKLYYHTKNEHEYICPVKYISGIYARGIYWEVDIWGDNLLSMSLKSKLGFNDIETKEQFNVLIKYLDFCDKQHKERKEFLTTIK